MPELNKITSLLRRYSTNQKERKREIEKHVEMDEEFIIPSIIHATRRQCRDNENNHGLISAQICNVLVPSRICPFSRL